MLILGIESSCDDTAAAVYDSETNTVLSNIISSQNEVHARFGGIVPELASRCHVASIWPVVQQALEGAAVQLEQIELIAATQGPGLVGSLLVGFTFAKSLSLVTGIPCVGVDHMAGHILSCKLNQEQPEFPYTALIVSGGNTTLFSVGDAVTFTRLGRTRDDAAGEAFDKVAKLLGLGYPGGPIISKLAEQGDSSAIPFPRAWLDKTSLDFSFSGLKTSVLNYVRTNQQKNIPLNMENICASFQEAVVEVLVKKTIIAAQSNNHSQIVLGGGVASNKHLREQMGSEAQAHGLKLSVAKPVYCTDNGAMIALAGHYQYQQGNLTSIDDDAYSRSPLL
ncbi:MAG: tRNA (adenosine(37)-N6)-threonylcarbamoyltransferase complex transferase subunit TsaD [Desulfobulbus propionicus]|nr:MAG: tRNA (adenosine(37)-N6)-threonylcarbamoyltransferase complex transferase subunit TsaD [Desulfobulbus propionicus]